MVLKTMKLLLACMLTLGVLVTIGGCGSEDAVEPAVENVEEESAVEEHEEPAIEEPEEQPAEEQPATERDGALTPGIYRGVVVASDGEIREGEITFRFEVELDDGGETVVVTTQRELCPPESVVEVELTGDGEWTYVRFVE